MIKTIQGDSLEYLKSMPDNTAEMKKWAEKINATLKGMQRNNNTRYEQPKKEIEKETEDEKR